MLPVRFYSALFGLGDARIVFYAVFNQLRYVFRALSFALFPVLYCPRWDIQSRAELRLRQPRGLPYIFNRLHLYALLGIFPLTTYILPRCVIGVKEDFLTAKTATVKVAVFQYSYIILYYMP